MCESRACKQASQWNVLIGPFYFHFNKTSPPPLPLPQLPTLSPPLLSSRPAPWTSHHPPFPSPSSSAPNVNELGNGAICGGGGRRFELKTKAATKCTTGRKEEVPREVKVVVVKGEGVTWKEKLDKGGEKVEIPRTRWALASWVLFMITCRWWDPAITTVCDARLLSRLPKFLLVQAKLVCTCVRFVIKRTILHVTFPL